MLKFLQLFFLLVLISFFGIFFLSSSVQAEKLSQSTQKGLLDFDMPLSYIDRHDQQQPEGPAESRVEYTYGTDNYYKQPQTLLTPEKQLKNFQQTKAYVRQQNFVKIQQKQEAVNQLDQAMTEFQKYKQAYDQSRQSYNYSNYVNPYYNKEEQFSTKIYPYPLEFLDAQNCLKPYPHCEKHYQQPFYSYNSYMNIFNIPGYIGNVESAYDGLDNDNDAFIDEGFAQGNVQILFGDSGANKDDEWALYIDGKFMGHNDSGQFRNWDLNLFPGSHKIQVVGVNIPDNSGTYSIVFKNAAVLSGSPLAGKNLRQGQTLEWIIHVR